MAAVDSLLRLMTVRNAELLIVASGEVPVLRRAGEASPLSMPALDAGLVAAFVQEVTGDDAPAAFELVGKLERSYVTSDGDAFHVVLERRGGGVRLTFRPRDASAPAADATAAASAATRAAAEPRFIPRLPVRPASRDAGTPPADAVRPDAQRDHGRDSGPRPAPSPAPAAADFDDDVPLPPDARRAPAGDVPPALAALLQRAVYDNASDVLLSEGGPPRLRIAGELVAADDHHCTAAEILALVRGGAGDRGVAALDTRGSIDFPIAVAGGARFRVNAFHQQLGLAAALRPIRADIPTTRQLGLPDDLHDLTSYPHGLVLVTGPAGSGKSTTLVALLEHINRTRACHVVTLEDPIEYVYTPRRALVHQREIGTHVTSFAAGLRAALRESPDVLMLGEMRDLATIAAAMTAAETGHLVLATLHAGSAAVAIDRIIDVFPEHQQQQIRIQLAGVLRAVVTQFLVPTAARTGGARVPAIEKMIVSRAIAHQIRENRVHQIPSQILTGRADGSWPLERSLADLIRERKIDRQTARSVAHDIDFLEQLLRR